MHEPHHHDPIEDNIDTHPVKLAIGVVIGAVALIIGIYLVVLLAVSSYGARDLKGDPSMSDKSVSKRLAPVAGRHRSMRLRRPLPLPGPRHGCRGIGPKRERQPRHGVRRCHARNRRW